jgi:tetratricopeptide (TPR) repeat protein
MKLRLIYLLTTALAATQTPGARDAVAIAQDQFNRGDYREAIATLSAALTIDAHDARLFHLRSRSYLEQKDYGNAVADAERAASERPDNSEYQRWLGRAYGAEAEQTRSYSLAKKVRRAFEEAVRLEPSNVAARRDLLEYYLDAPWILGGSRDKAEKQVEAIAAIDPVAGYLGRAISSRHDKKFDEAEADYQRVLDLRPGGIEPYLEVADFYEARGNGPKVARAIEQAARIDPADPRLSYYKGLALVLANENPSEADRLLRQYLTTAPARSDWPSHAAVHDWLGRLNEQTGNKKLAADEYRAALALDPDLDRAREALRRIESGHRR